MKWVIAVAGTVAAVFVGAMVFAQIRPATADHNAPQPVYSVVWRDGVVQALYGTPDDADHCHRQDVVVEGEGSSFGVYGEKKADGETYWTVCGTPGHADLFATDDSPIGTSVTVNGRPFVIGR